MASDDGITPSQFRVETSSDDGGVALVHQYRLCDWAPWVDQMTLPEITCAAQEHARVCDGQPQPRPPRPPEPDLPPRQFVPAVWSDAILDQMKAKKLTP